MPESDPDSTLEQIALSLSDGTQVDWKTAAECPADASRVVRGLRALEKLIIPAFGSSVGAADDALVAVPGVWGPLQVIERIGRGAFGDVYRAIDTRLGREVALKLIRSARAEAALSERVVAEGRRLARVRHPNVVTVFGAECIDGRYGIWMELVAGPTLAAEVAARGPFPVEEAVRDTRDVASALAAVHAAGLLHRDIKAHNVLRAPDGRPILADFGAGRELEPGADGARDRAGTPMYVAPEILSQGQASVASDIYSLGILLYFLLTGRYPVSGRSVSEIASAHQSGDVAPATQYRRGLGRGLGAIVRRATAPDPSRRFASAADFERALTAWLRSREWRRGAVTAVRTGGASTIDSVVRLPAGQRAAAVLGVLLVVAVLTGGAVYAARDYFAVQSDMVNAMSATSRVMLQGTRESVRARDVQGAVRVLSGFAIVTGVRVRLACLYDSQGRLFAERNWPAEGEAAVLACPPQPPRDSVEWGRDWMGFTADVIGSPPDGKQSLHLVLDEPRDTAKKWRVALGMGTAWLIVVGALGVAGIAWVVRRVRSRNEPRT